jgi:hypothetical protein
MPVPLKICGLCGHETKQMWAHVESNHFNDIPYPQPCSWEMYQAYRKAFLSMLHDIHPSLKNKRVFKTREELEEANMEYQ